MKVLLLALAACTPALGASEQAIRGGATDDGDPAVVALSIGGAYTYCTASLIAPHTLLTAGHCSATIVTAEFGTDASAPTASLDVIDSVTHPMYTGEGQPYDFALMRLGSASDVTPLEINREPLTELGMPIRHVGFGVTDDTTMDGGGTKRTVTYPLNTIDDVLIYSGAPDQQTCSGDSGAPGFMTIGGREVLVGVVSDGPNCDLPQDGWDDRVDVVTDWIDQTSSAWEPSGGCNTGRGSSALVAFALIRSLRARRGRPSPDRRSRSSESA
ncbi:MAG: trypsin-like serine protease [Kofleriaceae bacterium]